MTKFWKIAFASGRQGLGFGLLFTLALLALVLAPVIVIVVAALELSRSCLLPAWRRLSGRQRRVPRRPRRAWSE